MKKNIWLEYYKSSKGAKIFIIEAKFFDSNCSFEKERFYMRQSSDSYIFLQALHHIKTSKDDLLFKNL